jgi:hypothetical protein
MLLREFLKQPDIVASRIQIVGVFRTEGGECYVLAHEGQPPIPLPRPFALIEFTAANPDPDLAPAQMEAVRRRFNLGHSTFRFPARRRE